MRTLFGQHPNNALEDAVHELQYQYFYFGHGYMVCCLPRRSTFIASRLFSGMARLALFFETRLQLADLSLELPDVLFQL